MGLTASPLCQLSRAGLRDRWLQPSPAEGPPQPTAVSTACPRGLLQARPAQPGPAPSWALPVPCFRPQSVPPRPAPTGAFVRGPCDLGPHPASLQSGREQRSREVAEGAGRDRTGFAPGLTGLGMCPGPSPVTWGLGHRALLKLRSLDRHHRHHLEIC